MQDPKIENNEKPKVKEPADLSDLFTPGLFRKLEGTAYERPLNKPTDRQPEKEDREDNA